MTANFSGPSGRGTVERLTFARWVALPENRFGRAAVRRVAACLESQRNYRQINPLFLHGPPGTGKTHLVWALVHEVTRRRPDLAVRVLDAGDGPLDEVGDCDLVIIEDMQRLPSHGTENLARRIDDWRARQQQMVFTATIGPCRLDNLPLRLTSRLSGGLVVGLESLTVSSRLEILIDRAGRRQLAVSRAVLVWLAEHLGGGRQLEGALNRLEMLARSRRDPLDVAAVAEHFREDACAARPTIERIARRVGGYFQLDPLQLQSRCRQRQAMLPRQLGMYLARQLTENSLTEIGAYFGGRDHSTVLHACRKVEQVLARDTALSGAVRQLHADLV